MLREIGEPAYSVDASVGDKAWSDDVISDERQGRYNKLDKTTTHYATRLQVSRMEKTKTIFSKGFQKLTQVDPNQMWT